MSVTDDSTLVSNFHSSLLIASTSIRIGNGKNNGIKCRCDRITFSHLTAETIIISVMAGCLFYK